ncbi:hypothetical protein D3C75_1023260 [compost metagenome]
MSIHIKGEPPAQSSKEYTCMKCNHTGPTKWYWITGNYMIWARGCEKCAGGTFITGAK